MNYNLIQHRDKEPFEAIISGRKSYEIRLLDEKRQKIKLGWTIKGVLKGHEGIFFYSKVIGLSIFKNFSDLYKVLDVEDYEKELLSKVYTKEKEMKYGVLVIHFELKK